MSINFHATFDGKVFHPEVDLNLKPNTRYVVIIEDEKKELLTTQLDCWRYGVGYIDHCLRMKEQAWMR